ncbi:amiloride-sensitive sodium channel subunit gamma-like [Branchiostoma floridae]|uniref:Amiloride-sensitive sodium channel subunit gamma-like n=1 Tax=Branchiostoma floridae TaxID=7739 RepID=A0A9J7HVH7_BRAFL|nr:amiloride-sensitive sodium channel subunit gamma-like [Branchiostoma floridae]
MATKNPSLRSTLRKYGENTSAHGIPRAVTTKSFVRRLFWTCLFLASLSYFLYQAQTLVYKYIKYPVTTDVTIQWSALQFPAVTICNANPLRYRQLVRLGSAEFENAGFIPKPANPPQNGSAPSTTQAPTTLANDDDYDYDAFHGDFETINSFTGLLVQLNDSMKQSLGHQARDLIQECQFDGRPCSFRNFTLFTDSTYGNCFTFNKEEFIPGRSPHSVTSAGPSHGLSLILYIEQEEYIPRIAEKAGVRVVIHSNEVFPFPEAEGFDAPPGSLTSAGLRLTHISRLGGKYGDCTDGAGHELLYPGGYTQQNCIATCHQDHMINICGCADISYMLPQGATYCNFSTSVATCEEGVKRRIATANLTCACPASCSDRVFRKSIGLAEWPADSYLPTVLSKLRTKSRGPGTGILGDSDEFKRNLLKVNIYYEALNFERITESPGYEVENLLGDIGGQLGLWVGMSCLSAMEIMEVLVDIVIILCKKMSGRGRPTSPNVVDVAGTDRNDTYNAHTAAIRVTEKM